MGGWIASIVGMPATTIRHSRAVAILYPGRVAVRPSVTVANFYSGDTSRSHNGPGIPRGSMRLHA